MYRLRLFGGFELTDPQGRTVSLPSRKDAALLAFLSLQEQSADRLYLADLLWQRSAEEQARKSLRQSLVSLRRAVNRDCDILISRRSQSVSINREEISVDTREFETAAQQGDFDLAASLYGGALLRDFRTPTDAFDEWLLMERARLEDIALKVFDEKARNLIGKCDWNGAIEAARATIATNPLNEAGYRLLMEALNGAGRRSEALLQYQQLTKLLKEELGVLPSPETNTLNQRLKETSSRHKAQSSVRNATHSQWTPDESTERKVPEVAKSQRVQFTTSADGTHIAWASIGEGPPVLKAPNWMNHLEFEWNSPIVAPFLSEFARDYRFVRFDQRGNGLSDWDVERIDVDAIIEDMEAVVEAAGLKQFALYGVSQGAGFSVRYAARHPEQVSCLVLLGGFLKGGLARGNPGAKKFFDTAEMMIGNGWGSTNPTYREFFTSNFIPDASLDVRNSWDEMQRMSSNAANAIRIQEMNAIIDVVEFAEEVKVPTLVLHMSGDRIVPLSWGRETARLISGAQFVELPGNDHVVLEGQPCFDMFFEEVRAFLAEHGPS